MNEQAARKLMMELLYGEISETDKKNLEQYLQTHGELMEELKGLRAVHNMLQKAPEIEMEKQLWPVEPHNRSFAEWRTQAAKLLPRSKWGKTLVAVAACLLLFFIGVAAANLNIHTTKSGFSLHLGYGRQIVQVRSKPKQSKPQQVVFTKEQVEAIVQKVKENNIQILAKYAQKLTENNQQQLHQVVDYFKQRRKNDLQLFQTTLNQYQQKTNDRLLQTHQVMGQIVQAVAAKYQ